MIFSQRRKGAKFETIRTIAYCLLPIALAACSSIPAAFWEKDRDFALYGLYQVNPTLGLSGFGMVTYTSKSVDDEKLKSIRDDIDTIKRIITAIVARLYPEQAEKGAAF